MKELNIEYESPERSIDEEFILSLSQVEDWENEASKNIGLTISRLWKDQGIQSCFERSQEFQLIDCAA